MDISEVGSGETSAKASPRAVPSVPGYDEVVERNQIGILLQPGDLTVRNGDIAVTKWGDLMLVNEDYSAFFNLVQEWRFNYPTLKVMFETVFETFEKQRQLAEETEDLFPRPTNAHPHPLFNPEMDFAAYHRLIDEDGAAEVARGTYAGAVVIVIVKALQSFKDNVAATRQEWTQSGSLFGGHSLGQVLEASANNVRHNDEWAKTRPPTRKQLGSIRVLAAALDEPIAADGKGHRL
ncbi:MAG: hypothetical protein KGL11_10985, partial [Alphaproteobacteria bacterium]|nr:hypothetical protein [Alphaproteobacteria bacterium]